MIAVSVIIPVYNVENYLEDCLHSVMNQTLDNIEIICVEDCSTDHSFDLLREIKKKDSRIKILKNEMNVGLPASRNRGLEIAKGKYVYFLDSDDMLEVDAFEKLYTISECLGLDIVYFNTRQILESDSLTDFLSYKAQHTFYTKKPMIGKRLFVEFMKRRDFDESVCRQFYNREFIEKNELLFKEGIVHEDGLFSFQTIMKASKVYCVPLQCHIYRRHGNSITTNPDLVLKRLFGALYSYKQFYDYQSVCEDTDVSEQIDTLLQSFCRGIVREYKNLDSIDKDIVKENREIFRNLPIITSALYGGFFPYKLPSDVMKKIREKEYVIIYGAGQVGCALWDLLDERGVKVTCFAVTKLEQTTLCRGCEIVEMDKLSEYRKTAALLIATMGAADEMEKKAQSLGFEDIIRCI